MLDALNNTLDTITVAYLMTVIYANDHGFEWDYYHHWIPKNPFKGSSNYKGKSWGGHRDD